MREIQERANDIVRKIDEKFGVVRDNNVSLVQLFEELGELVRPFNTMNVKRQELDSENLKEELADVLILVSNIASMNNINLEAAVLDKIRELERRHDL